VSIFNDKGRVWIHDLPEMLKLGEWIDNSYNGISVRQEVVNQPNSDYAVRWRNQYNSNTSIVNIDSVYRIETFYYFSGSFKGWTYLSHSVEPDSLYFYVSFENLSVSEFTD
jgi:hypothetical protein